MANIIFAFLRGPLRDVRPTSGTPLRNSALNALDAFMGTDPILDSGSSPGMTPRLRFHLYRGYGGQAGHVVQVFLSLSSPSLVTS